MTKENELQNELDQKNHLLIQKTNQLNVIHAVNEGLINKLSIDEIYDQVGDYMQQLFSVDTILIVKFDTIKMQSAIKYLWEKGSKFSTADHYTNFSRTEYWLFENKRTLLVNEDKIEEFTRDFEMTVTPGTESAVSMMFVPMIVGDEVRGLVSLQNVTKGKLFNDSDLQLLATLTNSMSVALENAVLFDKTSKLLKLSEQHAAELYTVNNITQALVSQLDLDKLIIRVGDQMRDLFNANIVYLGLLDKKTNMINFPYRFGDESLAIPIKYGEGITSDIIRTGLPRLVNRDTEKEFQKQGIEAKGKVSASYLGVPVPVGNEIIGVLSVQSTMFENRFSEDDMRLLSTIAGHVGVALHNAKLFEQTLKSQEESEEARAMAERANESKSIFLSTVSHELRTPLTSVIGFTKLIRKRFSQVIFPLLTSGDKKIDRAVSQISENLDVVIAEGERLTQLINDVLDLAKIEAGKMSWEEDDVDIKDVMEHALTATYTIFKDKNLVIRREMPDGLPIITGDRNKLIQVVINLLSNAAKFTDKGQVVCTASREDGSVIVAIKDTGSGIPESEQTLVFEKFRQVGDTLTDKPKGTGLGLPICKEIIEHHGGKLWLESELGKGSTFYFSIPLINKEREY